MFSPQVIALANTVVDKRPDDNAVVAGWLGFGVFMGLLLAVILLGWSLSRHLKKVRANAERGDVFDPSGKESRRTQV